MSDQESYSTMRPIRRTLQPGFYVVTRDGFRQGKPFRPSGPRSHAMCLSIATATAGLHGEAIRVLRSDGKSAPVEIAVALPSLNGDLAR